MSSRNRRGDSERETRHAVRRAGWAGAWALLTAVLLWSSSSVEPSPWAWLAAFERAGGDKLVHAVLFGVQAWLLCRCRPGLRTTGWLAVCFGAAAAYGAVTEVGQLAAPGRQASVADAVSDVVGAAVGVAWCARRSRPG